LRRLLQPAHDVVANATASAQQAAIQVTATPAVVQGAVSVADKVTAAALTVIVAGTVGVGAVAIRHTQAPAKPSPVAAAPAPVPASDVVVVPPIRSKPVDVPHHKAQHKPVHETQDGDQGQTGTVPVDTPESPAPTDPSPTPVPEGPPPPPPPAPAWTGGFAASGGIQAASLALVSQRVTGPHDQRLFGEVMTGTVVDGNANAKSIGALYIDFGGSISGATGSLSSLWLWIDTEEGQYKYAAGGTLRAVTQAEDGSTTYVFSGGYSLSSVPEAVGTLVPHDGTISISLGFWGDGSLYATAVSMDES
jgi:hypothetical protein